MLLNELYDSDKDIAEKIVVISDQLKSDYENKKIKKPWTLSELLGYFSKFGVTLDKTDLYSMIKNPPLKNVIKNIQGDKVVFKGDKTEKNALPPETSDQKKTVAKMAKHALKK